MKAVPFEPLDPGQYRELVRRALAEDLGWGDLTTETVIDRSMQARGVILVKAPCVIAGVDVACEAFRQLDPAVNITINRNDGVRCVPGDVVATVRGTASGLLTAERTALNFIQRMSGIATLTRRFVEAVQGTGAIILDTRKTAPGLRPLDKWAVRLGGGQNHRFGLFDMALIKDNHIAAAGSISAAVERVRAGDEQSRPIEVEVKNLTELQETLELAVDRILLDNMSLDEMREAVRLANGQTPLEASGNITLDNVAAVAATGVDYISTGALTHSVQALDISFIVGD